MSLTSDEQRICALTGINPHDFIETREQDKNEALNRETPLSKEEQNKIYAMLGTTPEEVAKCNEQNMMADALCQGELGAYIALNSEVHTEGGAPEWIELLPAGRTITGRDGRTWNNDRPETILAAFVAEGKDLPIDWEHSTQMKASKGEEAPAAGWVKAMEMRAGALWGRVEWTQKGAASIASRAYRYLSPVFHFSIEAKRVLRIVSCGLTNQPNLLLTALNCQHRATSIPGS